MMIDDQDTENVKKDAEKNKFNSRYEAINGTL